MSAKASSIRPARDIHFRQCVDADVVHVDADLFVPEFDLARRREQLSRATPRAWHVGRRTVEGHRQHHGGRAGEGRRIGQRADETEAAGPRRNLAGVAGAGGASRLLVAMLGECQAVHDELPAGRIELGSFAFASPVRAPRPRGR